jgi:spermidine/putrescine-binding protein
VDEGLVQEIDTTKLKNWCKVPESFRKVGQFNGKQYFIPWDWGFSSVLYRTDKVPNVDSWSALLDPMYAGHVVMWDDGPGAVTVSSYVHGWDETAITADQLAQSKAEWTAVLKANPTRWLAEPELIDSFENGDGWLAYSWQGRTPRCSPTARSRWPTRTRRKAATPGSACTAFAPTAPTSTSRCASSTRSSAT